MFGQLLANKNKIATMFSDSNIPCSASKHGPRATKHPGTNDRSYGHMASHHSVQLQEWRLVGSHVSTRMFRIPVSGQACDEKPTTRLACLVDRLVGCLVVGRQAYNYWSMPWQRQHHTPPYPDCIRLSSAALVTTRVFGCGTSGLEWLRPTF
jgi:hypothetical protein